MPPKKKVAASDGTEAEGGVSTLTLLPSQLNPKLTTFSQTFRWTLENERKVTRTPSLLLLTDTLTH